MKETTKGRHCEVHLKATHVFWPYEVSSAGQRQLTSFTTVNSILLPADLTQRSSSKRLLFICSLRFTTDNLKRPLNPLLLHLVMQTRLEVRRDSGLEEDICTDAPAPSQTSFVLTCVFFFLPIFNCPAVT